MIVLDASVALSWFFEDEATAAGDAVLERVLAEGAISPAFWRLEVANVLTVGLRRGRLTPQGFERSLWAAQALPVTLDAQDLEAVNRSVQLARRHSLSVYDACYLELAIRLQLSLATTDNKLAATARKEKAEVLP